MRQATQERTEKRGRCAKVDIIYDETSTFWTEVKRKLFWHKINPAARLEQLGCGAGDLTGVYARQLLPTTASFYSPSLSCFVAFSPFRKHFVLLPSLATFVGFLFHFSSCHLSICLFPTHPQTSRICICPPWPATRGGVAPAGKTVTMRAVELATHWHRRPPAIPPFA